MMTQELVRHLFSYKDGILTWKNPTSKKFKPGDIAGSTASDGYLIVTIKGKLYRYHRVIYLYHYGHVPSSIDHIDGNKLNNKVENLRECTQSQNNCNQKSRGNHKNIHWNTNRNKWIVQIQIDKKKRHIGSFDDFELAELVAIEAREKYHRGFARHV